MTVPGVSCKALATQNSSEWPCSMCPIPPWLRLVGVRTSYIHCSNISWTPRVLDPITNPFLGPSSWLHPASYLGERLLSLSCLTPDNTWISCTNPYPELQFGQRPEMFKWLTLTCYWGGLSSHLSLLVFSLPFPRLHDCPSLVNTHASFQWPVLQYFWN